MDELSKPAPEETVSTIIRVLNTPKKTRFRDREMLKVRVGDGVNILDLVAWNMEAKKCCLSRGDVVKLTNHVCPETHGNMKHPPSITVTANTVIEKQEIVFPSIQECMKHRFLDRASEHSYSVVKGFIVQVYDTTTYFCSKCRKFTDKMCDCGSFPDPIHRITGVFSDGTKTMNFTTPSKDTAESLSGTRKSGAEVMDVKKLMNKPHTLLVYQKNNKLFIEEAIM